MRHYNEIIAAVAALALAVIIAFILIKLLNVNYSIPSIVGVGFMFLLRSSIQAKLDSRLIQGSARLFIDIPEIQRFYRNTITVWSEHSEMSPFTHLKLAELPEDPLTWAVMYSPLKFEALWSLFETCDLDSNEFLMDLNIEFAGYVLTNKRLLIHSKRQYLQLPLDKGIRLEQTSTDLLGKKIGRFKTTKDGEYTELSSHSFPETRLIDFAIKMKDWRIPELEVA